MVPQTDIESYLVLVAAATTGMFITCRVSWHDISEDLRRIAARESNHGIKESNNSDGLLGTFTEGLVYLFGLRTVLFRIVIGSIYVLAMLGTVAFLSWNTESFEDYSWRPEYYLCLFKDHKELVYFRSTIIRSVFIWQVVSFGTYVAVHFIIYLFLDKLKRVTYFTENAKNEITGSFNIFKHIINAVYGLPAFLSIMALLATGVLWIIFRLLWLLVLLVWQSFM